MTELPRIEHLDMSQFHDLAHRPFGTTCRSQYGGPARHLTLWWQYKASPLLKAQTVCRVGRHEWCRLFRRGDRHSVRTCWNCGVIDAPQGSDDET